MGSFSDKEFKLRFALVQRVRGENPFAPESRVTMTFDDITFLGNQALLALPKTAFLSSRRIPPEAVLKCYDWATDQRDAGRCVISGFHSDLEKDVLRFLLKGSQPMIVVLARRLYDQIPEEFGAALDAGRLLIVSTSSAARASDSTTRTRNRYIVTHADHVVVGALTPNGKLASLIATLPSVKVSMLK